MARTDGGFRLWLGGATASTLGDSVTFFALSWVLASHGAAVASLVLTAEGVPLALLILLGGALADRWGIRRVMISCDAAMALVLAAFAIGSLVAVPVWSLLLVAVLSGTAAALRRPAGGVFPRLFATGEQLPRTMATTTVWQQLAGIAGPAVGGALLAVGGLPTTSAVDAVSFLLILVILLRVRPPYEPPPAAADQTVWRRLRESFTAARQTPGAVATVWTIIGMAATILPLVSLCVPLIGHERHWGAGATGLVSTVWVVGGILVMTVVSRRGAPGPRIAQAGLVAAALGAVLLGEVDNYPVAVVAVGLVGIGTSLLTTRILPRFIGATPPDMLARFQGLLGLAQTGPVLVATALLGPLITAAGLPTALDVLAGVLLLTLLAATRAEHQLATASAPPAAATSPPASVRA